MAKVHYFGGWKRVNVKWIEPRSQCGRTKVRIAVPGDVCTCKACMNVIAAKDKRD